MKKTFQMGWVTVTHGVRAEGKFAVSMTQEQWESTDRRDIIGSALSNIGLSTKAHPPVHLKYCVVHKAAPQKSASLHQAIVCAIRTHARGAFFEQERYYYCYPQRGDQENATGTVLVDGVEYYFRVFGGAGLCDYAETLKIDEPA